MARIAALSLAALGLVVALSVEFDDAGAASRHAGAGAVDDARMAHAAAEPDNWVVHGGTYQGTQYSSLDQINARNVKDLRPAWSFDYDTVRGQESEPLVVDGVMYVTTAWSKVYALDAATGRQLWFFDPHVNGEQGAKACCDVVNRGAAVYHGKVYVGTLDGRLIALNARTGKPVWSAQTTTLGDNLTITGAPLVVRGKVIIGNGGADLGARGYVSAYDSDTGRQVWRFYLVPGETGKPDHATSDSIMEGLMRPTWSGDYARYGGGGTAWNSIVYDPDLDRIYVGTGNGSPWNPQIRTDRKGDNLFLCSVVALDPDTGSYVWHYQENPQEAWDYNSSMPMVLTDLVIAGVKRKVLLHAPKNGLFYVIDRDKGKVISAKPFVPITWTTGLDANGRPVEVPGARYENGPFMVRPSAAGAHNWHPMAYSPQTGLVYLNAAENGLLYGAGDHFDPKPFTMNTGVEITGAVPSRFFLLAWNPVTQSEAWRVPEKGGGVLATGGGLVFQGRGTGTGEFVAFRASDGRQLWSYKTPNGIEAGAITYRVNGVQYVAVSAGARAGGMVDTSHAVMPQPGRMIAFRLNGRGRLPQMPDPAPPPVQVSEQFTPAAVLRGRQIYAQSCGRCHGTGGDSSNIIPDLRRSPITADADAWQQVVYDGVLKGSGMIGWSGQFSREEVAMIRAYVLGRADALRKADGAEQSVTHSAPQQ